MFRGKEVRNKPTSDNLISPWASCCQHCCPVQESVASCCQISDQGDRETLVMNIRWITHGTDMRAGSSSQTIATPGTLAVLFSFDASAAFRISVTADTRYRLFLNGHCISV